MLSPILSETTEREFTEILSRTRKAVVTAHMSPDGDAIGASLGLACYLRSLEIDVAVVMPDRMPDFLVWLPGAKGVVCHDSHAGIAERLVDEADTVFCLDFNELSRTGTLAACIERSSARRVMLDHHLHPRMRCDAMVSRPEMSSTSEIVFRILWQMGYFPEMPVSAAVGIYCGMMTDTGGFTYNSSNPEIYYIVSQLMTKGFDKDRVYRRVYNNYTISRIRLMGYILCDNLRFFEDLRACYYTLSADEMRRFDFRKGDAEGLVNLPLSVKGMRLSIALREDTVNGHIRVSLRSVDDFPCNRMAAEYFNGGGHLNASGGELSCMMDEAVRVVEKAVEAYRDLL